MSGQKMSKMEKEEREGYIREYSKLSDEELEELARKKLNWYNKEKQEEEKSKAVSRNNHSN